MIEGRIGQDDVVRLLGDMSEHAVSEILASGAGWREIEEAARWLDDEDDVVREARHTLSGVVAQVVEIVRRERDFGDERRDRGTA